MSLSAIGRWTAKRHNAHPHSIAHHIITYYSQAREIREHNKFFSYCCLQVGIIQFITMAMYALKPFDAIH